MTTFSLSKKVNYKKLQASNILKIKRRNEIFYFSVTFFLLLKHAFFYFFVVGNHLNIVFPLHNSFKWLWVDNDFVAHIKLTAAAHITCQLCHIWFKCKFSKSNLTATLFAWWNVQKAINTLEDIQHSRGIIENNKNKHTLRQPIASLSNWSDRK